MRVKEEVIKMLKGTIEKFVKGNKPEVQSTGTYYTEGWGWLDYILVTVPESTVYESKETDSEGCVYFDYVFEIHGKVYRLYGHTGTAETPAIVKLTRLICPNSELDEYCDFCYEICMPVKPDQCKECKCYFCENSKNNIFPVGEKHEH